MLFLFFYFVFFCLERKQIKELGVLLVDIARYWYMPKVNGYRYVYRVILWLIRYRLIRQVLVTRVENRWRR